MNRLVRAVIRWARGQRCSARGQLLPGYGDLPVVCGRRYGHRGPHKDGIAVWAGESRLTDRAGGPS